MAGKPLHAKDPELAQASEDVIVSLGLLPKAAHIASLMHPDMAAASFEPGAASNVAWCNEHEQPVEKCRRQGLKTAQLVPTTVSAGDSDSDDDAEPAVELVEQLLPCEGVAIPRVADPTGEAVADAETFFANVREVKLAKRAVITASRKLKDSLKPFLVDDPTPAAIEKLHKENQVPCERHARFGFPRPARSRGTRVRIKGTDRFVFAEPHALCEWCVELAREEHRLATETEIRDHVAGRRRRKYDDQPHKSGAGRNHR